MNRRLADRIASIAVVDGDGEATILPGTGAVFGVQLRGRVHANDHLLARAGVTGIQSTARVYRYTPSTRSILVRFTAQGVSCLGAPAALASRNVALDDLIAPQRARELAERAAAAPTVERAIAAVVDLLATLPYSADPIVERALALIGDADLDEDRRIAQIARTLAVSERQLERRFRERVGVSPKRFASLRRFERGCELATRTPSLTHAALAAGYYDQPHFIRDFRRFAGTTPRDWLRRMSDSYK